MVATNLGSLVQLCCVEGGTPQTIAAGVCGELPVDGQHWVSHSPRWHVLPRSTLLRLQCALQGHCPEWALHFVHFPGLSFSSSWALCKSTDPGNWAVCLCPSQAQATQVTGCLTSALSQVGLAFYAHPWSWLLGFLGVPRGHNPRSAMCHLWGTDLRL